MHDAEKMIIEWLEEIIKKMWNDRERDTDNDGNDEIKDLEKNENDDFSINKSAEVGVLTAKHGKEQFIKYIEESLDEDGLGLPEEEKYYLKW